MKKKIERYFISGLCLLMLLLFLKYPAICTKLAGEGLTNWYRTIIPCLFPFMVLTSILHELQLETTIEKFFHPLLLCFRSASSYGKYCILIGLLCGFPMGAKIIAEHCQNGMLSKKEAQFLLPLCNQLSPAFCIGVIYPLAASLLPYHALLMTFLLMYAVPLFYGIILRKQYDSGSCSLINTFGSEQNEQVSIPKALDNSLTKNILPIIKIGSYMIIFRVCSCVPQLLIPMLKNIFSANTLLQHLIPLFQMNISMGLEITTGILQINTLKDFSPIILALSLFYHIHLGGISCIMQTYAFIEGSGLSIFRYCKVKLLFGMIDCIILSIYFIIF